jgi:hypothetical protein
MTIAYLFFNLKLKQLGYDKISNAIKPITIDVRPKNRSCPSDILTNFLNALRHADGDKNGSMPSNISTRANATATSDAAKLTAFTLLFLRSSQ